MFAIVPHYQRSRTTQLVDDRCQQRLIGSLTHPHAPGDGQWDKSAVRDGC
jgi:hypothetical protein